MNPTTPASSALDTLKALALRNIEDLEYVIDQLGGGPAGVPEELIEFVDGIKLRHYAALAEHMNVGVDERLGELRHLPEAAHVYDDGSPVQETFSSKYGVSTYYPRYGGPREVAFARHLVWTQQLEASMRAESKFGEIIDGIDWGSHGPPEDQ